MNDPQKHRTEPKQESKGVYVKPVLTDHGRLFEVTRSSSGTCADNNNAFQHQPTAEHPRCVFPDGTTIVFSG